MLETIIIIDFADHGLSELRDEYGHRWLGFSELEMLEIMGDNNIDIKNTTFFKGESLTVCIWEGLKCRSNPI